MEHPPDLIHRGGVGGITLGGPLPESVIPPDAEDRYVAGYHADFQPHEGFRLDAPAATVFLDRGPFLRLAAKRTPEPSSPGLARRAVKAARRGAAVRMVSIESSRPRTAAGLGVGSDLASLAAAYPDLQLSPVPPTFGDDECVAVNPSEPEIHHYFRTCMSAEAGESVVRILLFQEEDGRRSGDG